jgi:hypothetical protein
MQSAKIFASPAPLGFASHKRTASLVRRRGEAHKRKADPRARRKTSQAHEKRRLTALFRYVDKGCGVGARCRNHSARFVKALPNKKCPRKRIRPWAWGLGRYPCRERARGPIPWHRVHLPPEPPRPAVTYPGRRVLPPAYLTCKRSLSSPRGLQACAGTFPSRHGGMAV